MNIIKNKYGLLKVISQDPIDHIPKSGKKRSKHICKCDCGKTISVVTSELTRKTKGKKHCGCLTSKNRSSNHKTHGMSNTKEYKTWVDIIRRCTNENREQYKNYGGRGIKVCKSWLNNFESFINDVGFAPSKKHTIERIDNNSDYKPSNCIWATKTQQARNKRTTKLSLDQAIEIRQRSQFEKEIDLANEYNVCRKTINNIKNNKIWL